MSIRLSVRLKLKISVTIEPIGLYSSGIIPTGSVVVLSYFLGGWDTPNPSKNLNFPPKKNVFRQLLHINWYHQKFFIFFNYLLGQSP